MRRFIGALNRRFSSSRCRVTDSCIDSVAQAGQIVVSERLRNALRRSRSLRFDERREVELKGLSGKHSVFAAAWRA
jgi:class 3 adenylate cyclase